MTSANIQDVLGSDIIILIGAPLSGKGTQGQLLGKALNRPYVSTGDLFRTEVTSGSTLGKQINTYMQAGELIPNEFTITFLTTKFSDSIYRQGMILDGYPRNVSHVSIFDGILKALNQRVYAVIYLDVPKSQLDKRCAQRGRTDDNADIFERRYEVFREETLPLVDVFKLRNQLITVMCDSESPTEIHQRILSEILNMRKQQ